MTAPFSFESPADGEATAPATTSPAIGVTDPVQLIQRAVEASGIATYHWTIENDEIVWSANARDVLGTNPAGIKTGRAFAAFLDSENFTSRYDTVMHGSVADEGSGVPFQIEYKFRPEGRAGPHQCVARRPGPLVCRFRWPPDGSLWHDAPH